jgi:hypothetical protein
VTVLRFSFVAFIQTMLTFTEGRVGMKSGCRSDGDEMRVSVIKSRRMGWARHVARMREVGNVYSILVGKPERKRPLGIPRNRCRIILERIFGE